ncbi:MAG TPA: hypothetical protein VFK32_06040 [Tepidiformaceae bacterium]|nr:hypothetical protein [Tepidiformaceae bacterium]
MNRKAMTGQNPLARVTASLPNEAIRAIALGAVVVGAGALLAIAVDQSYDRTQVFAIVVAAVVLATLLIRRLPGDWFGAGMLFFAGASLSGMGLGVAALLSGVVAVCAAASGDSRAGRALDGGVLAFFVAAGAVVALVVGIALMVEG